MSKIAIDDELKLDIARRLYDEGSTPGHGCGQECYLDGLWMGLMLGGMRMAEYEQLEEELRDLMDKIVEGEVE